MSSSENDPVKPEKANPVNRRLLWFGFWGGAFAWFLHFMVIYIVAEFGCESDLQQIFWFGISAVAWLIVFAGIPFLGMAALATAAAFRCRILLRKRTRTDPGSKSALFIADTAIAGNLLFILIIIVQTTPVFFFLQNCGEYVA